MENKYNCDNDDDKTMMVIMMIKKKIEGVNNLLGKLLFNF